MQTANFLRSLFILVPFALVTIATSTRKEYTPLPMGYTVASDCGNATVISGPVTVLEDTVTEPANTTFLDFGLPMDKIYFGKENPVSAEIAPALIRSCIFSLTAGPTESTRTFTCSDNGVYACTVTFTKPN